MGRAARLFAEEGAQASALLAEGQRRARGDQEGRSDPGVGRCWRTTTRAGWESWSEKQIEQQCSPDGLVRRWAGQENCFLPCTYRLVECLARCVLDE